MGGDGTILRAVELCSDEGVVVLGVNLGQLGYLATVKPTQAKAAIKRFLAGAYHVEERMRLAVHIRRADGTVHVVRSALNEAIVERSDLGHTVRIKVALDGQPFTPYVADGVITATPLRARRHMRSAHVVQLLILDTRAGSRLLTCCSIGRLCWTQPLWCHFVVGGIGRPTCRWTVDPKDCLNLEMRQ